MWGLASIFARPTRLRITTAPMLSTPCTSGFDSRSGQIGALPPPPKRSWSRRIGPLWVLAV